MEYEIKKLVLFQPLFFSVQSTNSQEKMTIYTSKATKKNIAPQLEEYLTNPIFCGGASDKKDKEIPKGIYLFLQGNFSTTQQLNNAAEALWLEMLWQELDPLDDKIYIRELVHGNEKLIQLFRAIKCEQEDTL